MEILDVVFIISAISSLVTAILFIVLFINVSQIKKQLSDKNLYKQYEVYYAMGNKEKALEYLERYYHSRIFENKLSDDEQNRLRGLIESIKHDFSK
ncbi:MAG: hypothetical protein Q4A09_05560 [Capnocytophaga felis]|uniref:hypothetical protein n=1 Tax=Capnocytophaga cynodegmi TaxID=28189 RepID=UPI0027115BAA|nr:hypothetical protein [Capnocytophaga felis]